MGETFSARKREDSHGEIPKRAVETPQAILLAAVTTEAVTTEAATTQMVHSGV
jgi:hypothetical protein